MHDAPNSGGGGIATRGRPTSSGDDVPPPTAEGTGTAVGIQGSAGGA